MHIINMVRLYETYKNNRFIDLDTLMPKEEANMSLPIFEKIHHPL